MNKWISVFDEKPEFPNDSCLIMVLEDESYGKMTDLRVKVCEGLVGCGGYIPAANGEYGFDTLNEDGSVNMYKVKDGENESHVYPKYLVSTQDEANAVYNENEKSTIVTVEWNVEDMKDMFDPKWGNGDFRCTIYAKTVTNFIYSIGEIKMKATGEKPIVDERKDINLEFLNN